MPAVCEAALMKFWVLMESQTSQLRLSFLRDKAIWSDADIIAFQLFLVKLDMRFSDPVLGNGACMLGAMLLSQRSLSALWRVLSGKAKLDYDNTAEILINTYCIEDLDTEAQPWLEDMDDGEDRDGQGHGVLAREGWRRDGAKMQHAVDMVITEGVRRGLHVQQYYLDFMLYGHVDHESGKNVPVPTLLKGDKKIQLPREGWPERALRDQTTKALDVRFGVYNRRMDSNTQL